MPWLVPFILGVTSLLQLLLAQNQKLEITLEELHHAQTQLIQTEKMSSLGQMVAGIAHEINNPVNFISGNLVKSLRTFSRLDESIFKEADIHEGLESTLMILHNRLRARGNHKRIKVVKDYDSLPLIDCYPGQLNQVFMNLLTNSIDALEMRQEEENHHSSEIFIKTQKYKPNWLSIHIQDNGIGIPQDIYSKVFDPFFTTKPIGKGTGLGLSISYQIVVDKHQGKLYCNSTPGEGTEFIIEIPMMQTNSPVP